MISITEAKKIGHKKCIDILGYDFCLTYKESGTFAFGDEDDRVCCFLGIDTDPDESDNKISLVNKPFPFYVYLYVYKTDGRIEIIDVKKPL